MNRLPAIIRVFPRVGIETYRRSALGMRRARPLETVGRLNRTWRKRSERARVRAGKEKG